MQNTLYKKCTKGFIRILDKLANDIFKYPFKLKHLRLSSATTSIEQKEWILCINPNHIAYLWIFGHNILEAKDDRKMSAMIHKK